MAGINNRNFQRLVTINWDSMYEPRVIDEPRVLEYGKTSIEELLSNLGQIKDILTEADCDSFIFNFQRWELQRKQSISILKDLEEKLSHYQQQSISARNVSTVVGIAGGIASLVGFGLSFFESTRKDGENLIKYGSAVGVAGGTAAISFASLECFKNEHAMNKTKLILKKDLELTEKLFPFLKRSEDLEKLFCEVFNCSVLSDNVKDVLTVIDKIQCICDKGGKTYDDFVELLKSNAVGVYKSFDPNKGIDLMDIVERIQNLSDKPKFLLKKFCEDPEVRKAYHEMCVCLKRSPLAYELTKFKLIMEKLRKSDRFTSLLSFSKVLYTAKLVVFQIISVAINILSVIQQATDIDNEPCKYNKMITQVVDLLEMELEQMEKINVAVEMSRATID